MKLCIFTYNCDFHSFIRVAEIFYHIFPVCKIWFAILQSLSSAVLRLQAFLSPLQEELHINIPHPDSEAHCLQAHYRTGRSFHGYPRSEDTHFCIPGHPAGFPFPEVLLHWPGWVWFHLSGSTKIRDQCYVDQDCIVMSHIELELTNCFQERLTFNITDCWQTTNLDDGNYLSSSADLLSLCEKAALDFVRNVRNNLYGTSAIISATLLLQNGPVNLTGCHIHFFRLSIMNFPCF